MAQHPKLTIRQTGSVCTDVAPLNPEGSQMVEKKAQQNRSISPKPHRQTARAAIRPGGLSRRGLRQPYAGRQPRQQDILLVWPIRPARPIRLFVGKFPEMGRGDSPEENPQIFGGTRRRARPRRRTQGQAEGADPGRVVGVLPGASRQAAKEELGRTTNGSTTSTCPPSTTSGYRQSRNPLLPSGTAPLPRITARSRRTDARPSWRRCFPRHRPPWATPARIRP